MPRTVQACGYSLMELMFVTGLIAVMTATAIPQALATVDPSRTVAATRYLAGRMALARTQAVSRSATVALQFGVLNGAVAYSVFIDGNRNGVRARDIRDGIDRQIDAAVRLGDLFPHVDIANGASGSVTSGVQLSGGTNLLSFTPNGTATAGSIYVRSRDGTQFVIRILGVTGRTRVLRYDERARDWVPIV